MSYQNNVRSINPNVRAPDFTASNNMFNKAMSGFQGIIDRNGKEKLALAEGKAVGATQDAVQELQTAKSSEELQAMLTRMNASGAPINATQLSEAQSSQQVLLEEGRQRAQDVGFKERKVTDQEQSTSNSDANWVRDDKRAEELLYRSGITFRNEQTDRNARLKKEAATKKFNVANAASGEQVSAITNVSISELGKNLNMGGSNLANLSKSVGADGKFNADAAMKAYMTANPEADALQVADAKRRIALQNNKLAGQLGSYYNNISKIQPEDAGANQTVAGTVAEQANAMQKAVTTDQNLKTQRLIDLQNQKYGAQSPATAESALSMVNNLYSESGDGTRGQINNYVAQVLSGQHKNLIGIVPSVSQLNNALIAADNKGIPWNTFDEGAFVDSLVEANKGKAKTTKGTPPVAKSPYEVKQQKIVDSLRQAAGQTTAQ